MMCIGAASSHGTKTDSVQVLEEVCHQIDLRGHRLIEHTTAPALPRPD